VLDPKHRILLWGKGSLAEPVIRFAGQLGRPKLFSIGTRVLRPDVTFEELLPAADTILVTPQADCSTLPIAVAMAAGLPIVSTVTTTVAEMLEDRHTAAMVTKPQPRLLAQRILDVQADHNLQWAISDMARTEAFEYFALTRFLDQHRSLYTQFMSGDKIEIAQPQPGAGARFHGRAS
jgi:glycosyltransferase involved in cell wall biosynthesis